MTTEKCNNADMSAMKPKDVFSKGDIVYHSVLTEVPGQSPSVCYFDEQSLETLKRKRFWSEIGDRIDPSLKRFKTEFRLKDGSKLMVEAYPYGEKDATTDIPIGQTVKVVDETRKPSVGNGPKTVIYDHNRIESLIPPYETFTINTRSPSVGNRNYPVSFKQEGGRAVPSKFMTDAAVPFNYLLNSPSANAVRKVVVFNDSNREPCKTIVLFDNGDRVVVKRNENDKADLKESILWAIVKHSFGKSIERQLDRIVSMVTVDSKKLSIASKVDEASRKAKAKKARQVQVNG